MRTRRLLGAAALTAFIAVGLTGCVKMDMQLDLQSDNTVDGTMIFAISSEVAQMAGQDPAALAEQLSGETFDFSEGADVQSEPYDDGEYIGTTTTFKGEPLETFGTGQDESLSVVREGDEFVVSGTMDLTEAAMGGETMPGLGDSFDITIAMTFPGKVAEHNGELAGNTVTWTPVYGEVNEFSARGSAIDGGGGGLSLPLLIGIIAAVLIALGLVLFLVLRSRKGGRPAAAAASAYPEPTASYPPGQAQAPYAPAAPPMGAPAAPPAPPAPPGEQAPPAPPAPLQP